VFYHYLAATENDGKYSFVVQSCRLINWLDESYFLPGFIADFNQQYTKSAYKLKCSQHHQSKNNLSSMNSIC